MCVCARVHACACAHACVHMHFANAPASSPVFCCSGQNTLHATHQPNTHIPQHVPNTPNPTWPCTAQQQHSFPLPAPSIGAFPRVASEGCGSQLDQYLTSGAYNRDMEIAVRSAFDAMGIPVAPDAMPQQKSSPASAATKSKQVVIFDVDETLLSNVMANPWMFTKLAGRRLHGADWLQLRQQSAQNVPAIKPVQELYKVSHHGSGDAGG